MKSFPFFSYLLFSLLLGVTANAQNTYRISGIVKDNYNEPLLNAGVRVNNSSDSMVAGVLTDANGNFVVNGLTDGVYKVTVQFSGFAPDVHTVTIYNKDVDLGFLKLQVQSNVLKDVQITSNVIAVQQNGDTTSYNAKAYKTNPDATAEDLVRKMPGMDLSSGTPKAQGEAVTKVLVDNKPFLAMMQQLLWKIYLPALLTRFRYMMKKASRRSLQDLMMAIQQKQSISSLRRITEMALLESYLPVMVMKANIVLVGMSTILTATSGLV